CRDRPPGEPTAGVKVLHRAVRRVADTLYMTEDAFAKASGTKDKELFLIDGATHIETYWVPKYVDQAMQKLDVFFDKHI
ncbi:hypothetical protein ACQKDO_27475, partial [Raoultella planticola]